MGQTCVWIWIELQVYFVCSVIVLFWLYLYCLFFYHVCLVNKRFSKTECPRKYPQKIILNLFFRNIHVVEQLCIDTNILEISSEHILVRSEATNQESTINNVRSEDVNTTSEKTKSMTTRSCDRQTIRWLYNQNIFLKIARILPISCRQLFSRWVPRGFFPLTASEKQGYRVVLSQKTSMPAQCVHLHVLMYAVYLSTVISETVKVSEGWTVSIILMCQVLHGLVSNQHLYDWTSIPAVLAKGPTLMHHSPMSSLMVAPKDGWLGRVGMGSSWLSIKTVYLSMVTHLSANLVQCRATSLKRTMLAITTKIIYQQTGRVKVTNYFRVKTPYIIQFQ